MTLKYRVIFFKETGFTCTNELEQILTYYQVQLSKCNDIILMGTQKGI